jgi:hypothetical protein
MANRSAQQQSRKGAEESATALFSQSRASKPVPSFSYLPYKYVKQLIQGGALPIVNDIPRMIEEFKKPESGHSLSFAELMAHMIMSAISSEVIQCENKIQLSDDFYNECVLSFEHTTGIVSEDRELGIIHAKQLMMMLKKLGIVKIRNGKASVSFKQNHLYDKLFSSFWNMTKWSELFPSMPSTAALMQDDRYLLAELLLSRKGSFCVDDIAADYFSNAGLFFKEKMLYISFFDFSFFTWMRNFGIVRFSDSQDGRVRAELTEWGRWYLSSIE